MKSWWEEDEEFDLRGKTEDSFEAQKTYFDDGVVQGQPTAIRNLQKALGVRADGLIGPNTLDKVLHADGKVRQNFIRNVHEVEDEYLRKDPSQRIFERGHRARFNRY